MLCLLWCCRHVKLLRIVVREDLSMPMVDLVSGSDAMLQATSSSWMNLPEPR